MKKILLPLIVLTLVVACTKKEGADAASASKAGEKTVTIGSVGETMTYDKTEITVPAGQEITLTFKNNSTTLKHNWVLTQAGKENEVGIAGIQAGEAKQFIPDSPAVLAHTKLVDVNASETITFKAPPAGDYPYICTNAGHHISMRGMLHSK